MLLPLMHAIETHIQQAELPKNSLFRRTWHYLFIVVFTLLYHFPLLLPGMGMPPWGDFYVMHSPYRIVAAEAVHQMRMPFLTQSLFGGYHLLSDPQFAFFYPVNLLFALLVPNPNGELPLDLFMLFNLIALSMSAVFFVRSFGYKRLPSLAGAIIICMNGFVQMHITHVNILQVMTTGFIAGGLLARLAWSDGRQWRFALGAALALAAGNLAGHPQTTMFLHYALGIGMVLLSLKMWMTSRRFGSVVRILGWSAAAVILGIAISAIQLLPTAHLLGICRRINMTPFEAMDEAIRIQNLPSMLFPGFYLPLPWVVHWPFYVPQGMQWMVLNPLEGLTFCGVTACGLGILGFFGNLRRPMAHVLFWGAILLLAASVGPQTPVYPFMYHWLPGIKVVRVPSRVLWMFYTAWGLLAASGIDLMVRRQAAPGSKWTLACVLAAVWVGLLVLVGAYRNSWFDALIEVFVDIRGRFEEGVRQHPEVFFSALKQQAIIGSVFMVCLVTILAWAWRRGGTRTLAWIAVGVMSVEMFTYGFGRSYIIDQPPTGKVVCDAFGALSYKPKGRLDVPSFVDGGGAINIATVEDLRLTGGYSVTYPEWVRAFEPFDVPPWRRGVDSKLLDLWNVSDIIVLSRMVPAKIGPFAAAPVDDWGWTEIGTAWHAGTDVTSVSIRGLMPKKLVIDLDDVTTPVMQMYCLATAASTLAMTDGTTVAQMWAVPRDDTRTSIGFPMRLGMEISDSRYLDTVMHGEKPAHRKVEIAYTREAMWQWTDRAQMYAPHQVLPEPTVLKQLVWEAKGAFPSVFGLNQVFLVLQDGTIIPKMPMEIGDFKQVESADKSFHVLHRDTNIGYAWMTPTAIRGSYKETGNIMWRMLNKDFDLRHRVIVDKHEFEPGDIARLDAKDPAKFKGSADVTWKRPEKVVIRTRSNDRGWLVLSMTWDEGWKASVDGKPVKLERADGFGCAVPLDTGKHEVRLSYCPVYWWPGLGITLAALTLCLCGLFWRKRVKESASKGARTKKVPVNMSGGE